MDNLLKFVEKRNGTHKQGDICFIENQGILSTEYWLRMLHHEDWRLFTTGSLFRTKPHLDMVEGKLNRVELGSASSKTNYATFYQREDGTLRHEIKFKDPDKLHALFKNYDSSDLTKFNETAVSAFISCVDFVTPSSKRKRDPANYIRDPKWQEFIGSEPKKTNWTLVRQESERKQQSNDLIKLEKELKKLNGRIQNIKKRYPDVLPLGELEQRIKQMV
jgi:hypothetical protein